MGTSNVDLPERFGPDYQNIYKRLYTLNYFHGFFRSVPCVRCALMTKATVLDLFSIPLSNSLFESERLAGAAPILLTGEWSPYY
eukprot:COSAG02_NODE_4456_length_5340_cov_24.779050_3_plen_84_part_00